LVEEDELGERPDNVAVRPVGRVRNAVGEPVDEGWGGVISEVVLDGELRGVLSGFAGFSHTLVLFWMHLAPGFQGEAARRPRGREDMPEVGVFAQRARHRPNPIGATVAEVVEARPLSLVVRGLDAVNGTPVLDLKPHAPAFDAPRDARVPGWFGRLMEGYFGGEDGEEGPGSGAGCVGGLDHVQLAMPEGEERLAREFFSGTLGLGELPKPPGLAGKGGAWFGLPDGRQLHLSVESPFRPSKKATRPSSRRACGRRPRGSRPWDARSGGTTSSRPGGASIARTPSATGWSSWNRRRVPISGSAGLVEDRRTLVEVWSMGE
jgi:tRNA-Thr(GGU) m(6)t(6)A37 methyltransferase TsaA